MCNMHRPEQCKEPLHPHTVPNRPWAKVGADLFELRGQHYILLVDYYSNYFELTRLSSSARAKSVIEAMPSQFARHGIPEVLISDNGPQFSCGEFREFAQRWDFQHVTSSPRYPQSNGQAERAIGTVKSLMKKAIEDGSDVQLALLNFRNTVREGYSASPAQLLFGRRCRMFFPIQRAMLSPQLAADVSRDRKKSKNAQSVQHNKSAHNLTPIAPGSAIRMKLPSQDTWMLGECSKKLSNRSYLVLVDGQTYWRNRRALRAVNESAPQPECEECEIPKSPLSQAAGEIASTPFRSDDSVPMVEDHPSWEDPVLMKSTPQRDLSSDRVDSSPVRRSRRARKPPTYLADYQPK